MDPIAPNTPLQVRLEAQQWNGVMAALVKAPYEMAAPLIQAISEQLQKQVPANGAGEITLPGPPPPPMN